MYATLIENVGIPRFGMEQASQQIREFHRLGHLPRLDNAKSELENWCSVTPCIFVYGGIVELIVRPRIKTLIAVFTRYNGVNYLIYGMFSTTSDKHWITVKFQIIN